MPKHEMSARCERGPAGGALARVAFLAAGFTFSKGHRVLRVPTDPYLPYTFDGEETAMGVRAWTWGYDLYQASVRARDRERWSLRPGRAGWPGPPWSGRRRAA